MKKIFKRMTWNDWERYGRRKQGEQRVHVLQKLSWPFVRRVVVIPMLERMLAEAEARDRGE